MDLENKYYSIAIRYLSYRIRTEKEVRQYLQKKYIPDEILERVIDKLKKQRFIDDSDFSEMYISSRIKNKPKSKSLLKRELVNKGVSEETVEKMLQDSFSSFTDIENARKIIGKKGESIKKMSKQEAYRKLGGLLGRRGFSWEISKRAIDELFSD